MTQLAHNLMAFDCDDYVANDTKLVIESPKYGAMKVLRLRGGLEKGLSSWHLEDIKPQNGGCSSLKHFAWVYDSTWIWVWISSYNGSPNLKNPKNKNFKYLKFLASFWNLFGYRVEFPRSQFHYKLRKKNKFSHVGTNNGEKRRNSLWNVLGFIVILLSPIHNTLFI